MAKLPQYENRAPLMADAPTLQTPQYGEAIRRSKSIQGALDTVTKFANSQAERAVKQEAMEYTVANPLTAEQLEKARVSGINPIEQAMNGGMVWNDALQKLYGQQASAELTNKAYKHFDTTLARVETGELQDAGQIQQALEKPLAAWRNVLSQIDPEEANRFYAQSVNNGGSYYRKALGDLRTQEQLRQDELAKDTLSEKLKSLDMDFQSGMDPDMLFAKFENDMASTKELFKDSANRKSYEALVESEFTTGLYKHIAKDLSKQFGSTDEVILAMSEGKAGAWSKVYKELTFKQRDSLETEVKSYFKAIDQINQKKLTALNANATDIEKSIVNNETSPDRLKDNIIQLSDDASKLNGTAKVEAEARLGQVQSTINVANRLRNLSISGMEAEVERMEANLEIPDYTVEQAKAYLDKARTAYNQDAVAYELKRTSGTAGQIVYDGESQAIVLTGFKDQIATIKSSANYTPGDDILTKSQASEITSKLTSEGALNSGTKMALAQNIVDSFGDDAPGVFNQIAKDDPIFAQMGFLLVDNPENTINTMRVVNKGVSITKSTGLNIKSKFRTSEAGMALATSLGDFYPEVNDRVLATAEAYYIGKGGDTANLDADLIAESIWAASGGYVGNNGQRYGGAAQVGDSIVLIHDELRVDEIPDIIAESPLSFFADAVVDNPDTTGATILGLNSRTGAAESYNIADLQSAGLRRSGDNYVIIDDEGLPFKDINGNPIQIDLLRMRESYNNMKLIGPLDKPIAGYAYSPRKGPVRIYGGQTAAGKRTIEKKLQQR